VSADEAGPPRHQLRFALIFGGVVKQRADCLFLVAAMLDDMGGDGPVRYIGDRRSRAGLRPAASAPPPRLRLLGTSGSDLLFEHAIVRLSVR
jgi:hypothetical protein